MVAHYGVLRACPNRAKRDDSVRSPRLKATKFRAGEPEGKGDRINRGRQIDFRASGNHGCSTGFVGARRP